MFITREPTAVRTFVERVWAPDFARASRAPVRPSIGTRVGSAAVRVAAEVAAVLALR